MMTRRLCNTLVAALVVPVSFLTTGCNDQPRPVQDVIIQVHVPAPVVITREVTVRVPSEDDGDQTTDVAAASTPSSPSTSGTTSTTESADTTQPAQVAELPEKPEVPDAPTVISPSSEDPADATTDTIPISIDPTTDTTSESPVIATTGEPVTDTIVADAPAAAAAARPMPESEGLVR